MISFRTDRCTLQTDVNKKKLVFIDRSRHCVVLSLDVCLELQLWRARLLRCRNSSHPSFPAVLIALLPCLALPSILVLRPPNIFGS